jgi:hypothetical protein
VPNFAILINVPAGSTVTPFAGTTYEFIPFHARIEIAMVGQAGTLGDLVATFNSGSDLLLEESPISVAARYPVYPDDFLVEDDAAAGDRLRLILRNTSVADRKVLVFLKMAPIG